MWPDRVSNPRSLALESDAPPTALRGPAISILLIGYRKTVQDPALGSTLFA